MNPTVPNQSPTPPQPVEPALPPSGPPAAAIPQMPLPPQPPIPAANTLPNSGVPPMPMAPPAAMPPTTGAPYVAATPSPVVAPTALPAAPVPQAGMVQQPGVAQPAVAPKINPNSTQNTLQIAEVRDGIVIMNDGTFRSVVMVKSINFDLMSPQEREAIEYSYQGFLNSLYFPIQIFIRSQKVDIRPYLERLDKIRSEHDNMLLAMLMEDYLNFIDQLASQTNIMDKKFYVVIPFIPELDTQRAIDASKNFVSGFMSSFKGKTQHVVVNETDLQAAKEELRNRVQAVLSGLLQAGVQGLPLDTQELIELYYDTYNPDTATRQQLRNVDDLTAPVITKGEGAAPQPNLDRELQP